MIVYRVVKHEDEVYANVDSQSLPDVCLGTFATLEEGERPSAKGVIGDSWEKRDEIDRLTKARKKHRREILATEQKIKTGYYYHVKGTLVSYSIEEVTIIE